MVRSMLVAHSRHRIRYAVTINRQADILYNEQLPEYISRAYFEGDDTPHEIIRTDSGFGRFAGFAAG